MEIKIKYLAEQKFLAESRNHKIIIDQPKDKGGEDAGMNPLEIFLTSLGSCAGFYVKMYCQNAGVDTQNLEIGVSASLTADKPFRFQDIKVKIFLDSVGKRKQALLNFINNCPVNNTLKANPGVKFIV